MVNGMVQVPPCGPVVAGGALYFTDDGISQLALTKMLDLSSIKYVVLIWLLNCLLIVMLQFSTVSFYTWLEPCSSTASMAASILLEYRTEGDISFTIIQSFIESGK